MRGLILICLIFSLTVVAEEQEAKIIYKYKKYQKIDLGDMSVKGKLHTPGDLSVKDNKRNKFHENLYYRRDFDREMSQDFDDLR